VCIAFKRAQRQFKGGKTPLNCALALLSTNVTRTDTRTGGTQAAAESCHQVETFTLKISLERGEKFK